METIGSVNRKIVALILIIIGATIFVIGFGRGFVFHPSEEINSSELNATVNTEQKFSLNPVESVGIPVEIIIPKISLDAKVEEVGLTYIGNMGTPKILADSGWYKYGTAPGAVGSAVIDGHVDNGFSLPGVFSNLKNLSKGDDVYVMTDNKKKLHFVVVETEIYPFKNAPLTYIFNRNDAPRLNLITCSGKWVDSEQTDEDRLVVYTQLVE